MPAFGPRKPTQERFSAALFGWLLLVVSVPKEGPSSPILLGHYKCSAGCPVLGWFVNVLTLVGGHEYRLERFGDTAVVVHNIGSAHCGAFSIDTGVLLACTWSLRDKEVV